MDLFSTCEMCELCIESSKRIQKPKLLYGSMNSKILVIGSATDNLEFVADPVSNTNYFVNQMVDENIAVCFTVRCIQLDNSIDPQMAKTCYVYNRTLVRYFPLVAMTKEAAESFDIEWTGHLLQTATPYGKIIFVDDISQWKVIPDFSKFSGSNGKRTGGV